MQAGALGAVWRIPPLFHGQQPRLGSLAIAAGQGAQALCQLAWPCMRVVLHINDAQGHHALARLLQQAQPRIVLAPLVQAP